jgi:galactokinase
MNNKRKELVRKAFVEQFGGEPSLWAQAPGRVDLMGSHTDYNEGYVLTMTINRSTWIALRPRHDCQVRIFSLEMGEGAMFGLNDITPSADTRWSNYVRGVAKTLQVEGYVLPDSTG